MIAATEGGGRVDDVDAGAVVLEVLAFVAETKLRGEGGPVGFDLLGGRPANTGDKGFKGLLVVVQCADSAASFRVGIHRAVEVVDAGKRTGDQRVVLEAEVPAGVVLNGVGISVGGTGGGGKTEAGIALGAEVVVAEAVKQAAPEGFAHVRDVGGEAGAFEVQMTEAAGVGLMALQKRDGKAEGETPGKMALNADAGGP